MPRSTQLYTWTEWVATHVPDLPKHQAATVAEWSSEWFWLTPVDRPRSPWPWPRFSGRPSIPSASG
ncbi:hypothetical protein [Fimbriiglobus ruber]|uniref:hypothetical protein n=1 Tax=Fimbriiglobus ruber TaxID=1908690 RepID=UPI00117A59B6|nr:hypothetical protein [Fimbriiglobus ruber]